MIRVTGNAMFENIPLDKLFNRIERKCGLGWKQESVVNIVYMNGFDDLRLFTWHFFYTSVYTGHKHVIDFII